MKMVLRRHFCVLWTLSFSFAFIATVVNSLHTFDAASTTCFPSPYNGPDFTPGVLNYFRKKDDLSPTTQKQCPYVPHPYVPPRPNRVVNPNKTQIYPPPVRVQVTTNEVEDYGSKCLDSPGNCLQNGQPISLDSKYKMTLHGVYCSANDIWETGYLRGWIRVEIASKSSANINLNWVILIAVDEKTGETVGEFFYPEADGLTPKPYPTVSKVDSNYNLLPCFGIAAREPLNSNAYVNIVSKNTHNKHPCTPFASLVPAPQYSIYWRYAQNPCNADLNSGSSDVGRNIVFRLLTMDGPVTDSTKLGTLQSPILSVRNTTFAPTPEPFKGVACDANKNTMETEDSDWFIKNQNKVTIGDYPFKRCGKTSVLTDIETTGESYAGRCGSNPDGTIDPVATLENTPQCSKGGQSAITVTQNYTEMVNIMFNKCTELISPSKFIDDVWKNISVAIPTIQNNDFGYYLQYHTKLRKVLLNGVWNLRKIHGICMCIITFLIIPMNTFLARYYKETFLDVRISFCRVWFFVHNFVIPLKLQLYMGGIMCLMGGRYLLGVSRHTDAWIHRIVGFSSIGLFGFLCFFGGIRCNGMKARIASIFFHWLTGTVYHLLCMFLVWNSMSIPMSPSANVYIQTTDTVDPFAQGLYEPMFCMLLGSAVIQIIFHILMTVLMVLADKKMGFTRRRIYCPPPIPLQDEMEAEDMSGSKSRKIVLIVVGILHCAITIVSVCILLGADIDDNNNFGSMTCTHQPENGGKQAGSIHTFDFKTGYKPYIALNPLEDCPY